MTEHGTRTLNVKNLAVEFGRGKEKVRVVDGVTLAIDRGRTLALVGESGSGKSVTSLAVLGLLPLETARITADELNLLSRDGNLYDLSKIGASALRKLRGDVVAMIFQEPMTSLNPTHTIGRQISEVLKVHRKIGSKEARSKAVAMLDRVGIPDAAKRIDSYPHELSGGMRQRVMIAMSMICGPVLLIADEPTTALDVTVQAQILEEMRQLQDEFGMAMLFITHDLGVVAEVAQDVAVMYCGQIVETGTVGAVLRRPTHPYTRGLLASVPRPDRPRGGALQAIPGRVPDPRQLPPGCRFSPRCRFSRPELCDVAVPALEDNDQGGSVRCVRWREVEAEL